MTRTLILADVDNLIGSGTGPVDPQIAGRNAPLIPVVSPGDPCVVVCALNTSSAERFTSESLRRFADHLTLMTFGKNPLVEIVLTLTMPEAVDVALTRAIRCAATVETAGDFDQVVLFSGDRGIVGCLDTLLRGSRTPVKLYPNGAWWKRRVTRSSPALPAPPPTSEAATLAPPDWVGIDSPELAAAMAGRPVQVGSTDLHAVAREVSKSPGLLSQVGSTTTSLRGAARLSDRLRGMVPTLDCAEGDGVQFSQRGEPLGPAMTLSKGTTAPSATGIGAVTFSLGDGFRTVYATGLPCSIIQAALPSMRSLVQRTLEDAAILGALTGVGVLPMPDLSFDFDCLRGGLRCSLRHALPAEPLAWWLYPNGVERLSATIKYCVPAADRGPRLLSGDLSSIAGRACVLAEGTHRRSLVFRSPLASGSAVDLTRPAAIAGIVPASTPSADGGPALSCAFLSLGRRFERAERVACVAIQEVDRHVLKKASGWDLNLVDHLRRLPLVVSALEVERASSVRTGARGPSLSA